MTEKPKYKLSELFTDEELYRNFDCTASNFFLKKSTKTSLFHFGAHLIDISQEGFLNFFKSEGIVADCSFLVTESTLIQRMFFYSLKDMETIDMFSKDKQYMEEIVFAYKHTEQGDED